MNDRAHVIEIDRIMLTGLDQRRPGQLITLIEAEVLRALEGTGLRTPMDVGISETRIAGEVARTVVRSVQGGSDGV